MSDVVDSRPVCERKFVILEIVAFVGGLMLLHGGKHHVIDILCYQISETWYPVCQRAADLLLLMLWFAVLRRWRAEQYPKGLTRKGAVAGVGLGILLGTWVQLTVELAPFPSVFWHRPDVPVGLQYQWTHFPWLAAALFYAMGALREEALWRGYVLDALERQWGSGRALIVSAVGFALWHLATSRTNWELFEIAINGGVLLGAAYLWSRRLWLPIGVHFATNIVTTFFNGSAAFPDTAMPRVTFELHGALTVARFFLCKHVELLLGIVFVFLTVWAGRWKPYPKRVKPRPATLPQEPAS